jgi:MFS family permease
MNSTKVKIYISRTVVFLGFASFFTDISSEMIYPLLPIFIISILGGTQSSLGLIEGFAEATASILKWASGFWADKIHKRKGLVFFGYSISGLIRPMMSIAGSWPMVFFFRFVDRVGKGIRTSPRDALIADVTPENLRGAAYGFHRAMDHAGAVAGPLVASGMMWMGFNMRQVFAWAIAPSILALVVIHWGVKEGDRVAAAPVSAPVAEESADESTLYSKEFKFLMLPIFIFAIANSTDTFLLVQLAKKGIDPKWIPILWSCLHVVKMVSTFLGGRMADHKNKILLLGLAWVLFALVYGMFGVVTEPLWLIVVFLSYGLFFGLSEPSERAVVSLLANKNRRGSSFGIFNLSVGLAALPASLIFGWVWDRWGDFAAFSWASGMALVAAAGLWFWWRRYSAAVMARPL